MLCECNHPIIPLNYNFTMIFSHKGFKYAIVEPLQYVRGLPQSFTAERRSLSGHPSDSIDTRVLRRPGSVTTALGAPINDAIFLRLVTINYANTGRSTSPKLHHCANPVQAARLTKSMLVYTF
jgi:hypothetical protein